MNDKTKQDTFPEAGAVAYFGYKRTDGFEISLTLRDTDGKGLLKRIDGAIATVVKNGGTPLPLRGSSFPNKQAKPREYVGGRVCPLDGGKLIYTDTKKGRAIKCENSKYDFQTKQPYGCKHFEWVNAAPVTTTPPSDIPERQIRDDVPPKEADYYNEY